MAPEQLAGKEVSVKSDIYALGLVLYEMFTGKPAHQASSLAEMLKLREESQAEPFHADPRYRSRGGANHSEVPGARSAQSARIRAGCFRSACRAEIRWQRL